MTDKFWTKERLNQAIAMREAGRSFVDIGEAIGCTWKAVGSKINRLKHITPRQPRKDAWSPEMKAALAEHREAGMSWRAMAALLGRKESSIRDQARKMKVKAFLPETFWTADRVSALRTSVDKNMSARAIASMLGCTRNSVLGKVNRLGWSIQKPRHNHTKEAFDRIVDKTPFDVLNLDAYESSPVGLYDYDVDLAMKELRLARDVKAFSIDDVEVTPSGGVPIWDLKNRHCRYILNDTMDTESLRYCGGQIVKGGPWCATHHKICCTPIPVHKSVERRYR